MGVEQKPIGGKQAKHAIDAVSYVIAMINKPRKPTSIMRSQRRCQAFCVNGFRLVDVFGLHWLHLSGG
jgi:hypothetical protein